MLPLLNEPYANCCNHAPHAQVQYGLGQSESFYAWLIAVFNFGSVFGAAAGGFLVKFLPYWYLFAASLVAHTTGYVLYAVTYQGWLIMLSKFLSGLFLGIQWALSISYTARSSHEYVSLIEERNGPTYEGSVEKIKRYVFSSHTAGVGIGFIVGPGRCEILASCACMHGCTWYLQVLVEEVTGHYLYSFVDV